MTSTKKYNITIPRQKFCDNCKKFFIVMLHGSQRNNCPYCNSKKTHYKNGRGSYY